MTTNVLFTSLSLSVIHFVMILYITYYVRDGILGISITELIMC